MPEEQHRPGWFGRAVRDFIRVTISAGMRLYFRWRIHDAPRIEGAYVLVANHASLLDPIVLGAANPRPVAFFMNTVSYRDPLLRWFYKLFSTIPVDPGGLSRSALRAAHQTLDSGQVVGVFAEGGVSRDGELLLGNPGAVALVLSKNVSVVPVGLVGMREVLPYGASIPRPRRVEIRYGEPIPAAELMVGADRKERLARATERIMREIAKLTGQVSREEQLARQRKG